MSLRKIAIGVFAVATVLLTGCEQDVTSSNANVTKLNSGKWVPVSSVAVVTEKSTQTSMGETQTTDTTYTERETYSDTSEILLVTDDVITYYLNDTDSTVIATFTNDFAGEIEKMTREGANKSLTEIQDMGLTGKITKLVVRDYTSTVSGDTLTMAYTVDLGVSMTGEIMGITMSGTEEITTEVTDTFIGYEGDVPPSSWPSKEVNGSFGDL